MNTSMIPPNPFDAGILRAELPTKLNKLASMMDAVYGGTSSIEDLLTCILNLHDYPVEDAGEFLEELTADELFDLSARVSELTFLHGQTDSLNFL